MSPCFKSYCHGETYRYYTDGATRANPRSYGAMGTLIQKRALKEQNFASGVFKNWIVPLKGNYDILNITRPDVIADIHQQYIDAGADIITTNTFNSNRISQSDYRCEKYAHQLAYEGAKIAKDVASKCSERKVWVAGSVGSMNKSLTMDASGESADLTLLPMPITNK